MLCVSSSRNVICSFIGYIFPLLYPSNSCLSCCSLISELDMLIIMAFSAIGIGATILIPVDSKAIAEHTGLDKGTNVETHTIVEVGVPADGLFMQWLPADIDIIGGFTVTDSLQLSLQF